MEHDMWWYGDAFGHLAWLAFWGFIAAIVLVPQYLKHKERQRMHDTLRIAIEKGQPLPPELVKNLQSAEMAIPVRGPGSDLRRAVVLIAVGLGLAGLGYGFWYGLMAVNEIPAYIVGGIVAGSGAIPGFIGVAYLILFLTKHDSTAKS
jgi:hypothetical protein